MILWRVHCIDASALSVPFMNASWTLSAASYASWVGELQVQLPRKSASGATCGFAWYKFLPVSGSSVSRSSPPVVSTIGQLSVSGTIANLLKVLLS